jgi:FMN phosphatase YigB (HAD superfamily)
MASAPLGNDSHELWKKDTRLRLLAPELDAGSVRLLSLDVFDTLLFRACASPDDVFEMTARLAAEQGLFRRPATPAEFRSIRIAAERTARRLDESGAGETTLEQIYRLIPSSLGDLERIAALELETERAVGWLNPNVVSLIRTCNERNIPVALLSDMYLSSDQLVSLLAANGLKDRRLAAVLVSCEQGCGKSSGKLFDRLLETFPGIAPGEIVHIGDNETADVQGAAKRGIRAIHYDVVPETINSPFHWETVRHGAVLPEIRSLRKLAGATELRSETDNIEPGSGTESSMKSASVSGVPPVSEAGLEADGCDAERFFYRFGAEMMGPFVHAFCDWVLDRCLELDRTEVHPLMREAHLLAPALENAAKLRGLSIRIVPLYVSRQATLLASMDTFTERELSRVAELGLITIGEMLAMLGVADLAPRALRERSDMAVSQARESALEADAAEAALEFATGNTVYEALRAFLLAEPTRSRVLQTMAEQRTLLLRHIRQRCREPERLLTVDLGFNGTIQAAVDAAYDHARVARNHVHLMAVGTERSAERLLHGTDLRCWIGGGGEHNDLAKRFARSPGLIEELMMGEFGSTVRYDQSEAGEVVPVLAGLSIPEEQFRWKKACREGVFAFQRLYGEFRRAKPRLVRGGDPRQWCKTLHRVLDMPTPEEAVWLGDLVHQDNFGGVQTVRLCEPLPLDWESRGGDYLIDLASFGPKTADIFWPQGTLTRSMPYHLYRQFLRLRDSFGSAVVAFDTMHRLKQEGVRSLVLVGSGGFAELLRREAIAHRIEVEAAADTPEALERIVRSGGAERVFAVATLTDIAEVRQMILDVWARVRPGETPRIAEPVP